jgi:hypothetical protein
MVMMLCPKCGADNAQGSEFCGKCGASLTVPAGGAKKGLITGLIAGGAVLIAAALLLLLLLPGSAPGIIGTWYNEDLGQTIAFGSDGTVVITTLYGSCEADYSYDQSGGRGYIDIDGQQLVFSVSGETMTFEGKNGDTDFVLAHGDADIAQVIPTPTPGTLPSTTEMTVTAGPTQTEAPAQPEEPTQTAKQTQAPESTPSPSVSWDFELGPDVELRTMSPELVPENIGDIFQSVTDSSELDGMWYDRFGLGGTLNFFPDSDDCDVTYNWITIMFKFTYNNITKSGMLTNPNNNATMQFYLENDTIYLKTYEYIRDYVDQGW